MDASEYKESQRRVALDTAAAVIEGRVGPIEGSRILNRLSYDLVADPRIDKDFVIFLGVDSETDALPIGDVRKNWDALALEREDVKIANAQGFFRERVVEACRRLLERLRDVPL